MLRPRISPCLLIHKKGLVKTVGFKNPKYVGDPLNAVRIFNEKEVDEIFVGQFHLFLVIKTIKYHIFC